MSVDLCVVNFNTNEKLQRLIDTLDGSSIGQKRQWNLWIADNGSTDGSVRYLEEWGIPRGAAGVVYNDNIGYAAACNQLAAMGSAPYIGLLNADVWLLNEDVDKIIQSFENHPQAAIIGPKQRDEHSRVTHGGIFGTHVAPKHRGWKAFDYEDALFRDRLLAVTVSGSAYFVRRTAWEDLTNCSMYKEFCKSYLGVDPSGAFLPTQHFYEETYASYHANAHGLEVWYDGEISIGHTCHASDPITGGAQYFKPSQATFRAACAYHGIPCD